MICKITIGEGYELKDGKLAIAADVHRPRKCRFMGLRGALIAAI